MGVSYIIVVNTLAGSKRHFKNMIWLLSKNSKRALKPILVFAFLLASFSTPLTYAKEPFLAKQVLFEEKTDGFSLYRIPGIVVTAKGTILAYCEGRKLREADRGEIEIQLRRSWMEERPFPQPDRSPTWVRDFPETLICRKASAGKTWVARTSRP